MKIATLIFKAIGILVIYAFACGALNATGISEGFGWRALDRCLEPFRKFTALEISVLAVGIFLFTAGSVIPSGRRESIILPHSPWSSILLAAFAINVLVVFAVVGLILRSTNSRPEELGALYTAGVIEAGIGALIGSILMFLRRPRIIFLPALGLLFIGIAFLGTLFWLGTGGLP